MQEKSIKALKWIVTTLEDMEIPFQIGGGFVAIMYGVNRPLADIDIVVPTNELPRLREKVKDYITYGLKRYKDEKWDVTGMTIEYEGQEIDLAGAQGKKIFDENTNTWISLENDFSKSVYKEIAGIKIPIAPRDYLVSYKKILLRDVDIEDLKGMKEI
jgi:hypothetical protein